MANAQAVLQMISWGLFLVGIIGYCTWRDRENGGRWGSGYAVLVLTWLINGFVFYSMVLAYTFFECNFLELAGIKNVTFQDWSAALRLHGAVASILTMYAILKAGAGKWKLVP